MGSHIPKLCSHRSCKLVQHYGYNIIGEDMVFGEDQNELEYMLSSGKTAFEMQLLRKFEILVGKLSFQEKANIYNNVHGYRE